MLGGIWAVGVVVAVAVAFAAVDRVASGVTSPDTGHLSRDAISDELRRPPSRPAPRSSGAAKVAPSSSSSTSSTLGPRVTVVMPTPTTSIMPPPTTPRTTPRTTPPTIAANPTPTSAPAVTTPSTALAVPPHNTVTTSQGGTLITRCSGPETILFVAAVPKPGYQRTVDDEGSEGIEQSFVSANHQSNIEAQCSNGVVHAEVEEESADT